MDACDEDFLAVDIGRFGGQILVLTSGDQRQYIDDTEESEEEDGSSKESGPRGSGESAKRGPYHGNLEKSRQRGSPKRQLTHKLHKQVIMITTK